MQRTAEELNEITRGVIGAAMEVHGTLGPGLLESADRECLCRELTVRRIPFLREVARPVEYKGLRVECSYRLDLLVEGAVVVEIKSVEAVLRVHEAQLLIGWVAGRSACLSISMLPF